MFFESNEVLSSRIFSLDWESNSLAAAEADARDAKLESSAVPWQSRSRTANV
jgi:hypothetical protein